MAIAYREILIPGPFKMLLYYLRYWFSVWIMRKNISVLSGINVSAQGVPFLTICVCDKSIGKDVLICHAFPNIEDIRGFRERIDQLLYLYDQQQSVKKT